ncbi:MAG: hypothetical protein IJ575_03525, partial [Selenomonadaceae bacterium]|nr:hypothetical protein [Selenomonadaceae bacterium]
MEISVGAIANEISSDNIDNSKFTAGKIYWYNSNDGTFYCELPIPMQYTSPSSIRGALAKYSGIVYASSNTSNEVDRGSLFVCGFRMTENVTIDFDTSSGLKLYYNFDPSILGLNFSKYYKQNNNGKYQLAYGSSRVVRALVDNSFSIEGAAQVQINAGVDKPELIFSAVENLSNEVTITGGKGFVTINSGISLFESSPDENLTITASSDTSLGFSDVDQLQTIIFDSETTFVSIIGSASFEFDDEMHISSGEISLGGSSSIFGDISGNGVILSAGEVVESLDNIGDFVVISGIYGDNTAWSESGGETRFEVVSGGLNVVSRDENDNVIFNQTLNGESWSIPSDRNLFGYIPDGSQGSNGSSDLNGSSGSNENSDLNGSNGSGGSSDLDGSYGSNGNSDLNGSQGSNGSSNLDGSQGSGGSSDLDGSYGSNGNSNLDGSQGSNGSSDLEGSNGSNGSSDLDGSSGSNGSSNLDGSSGSSGNSDLNGSNGSIGSSDLDGSQGSSGNSDLNGSNGSNGNSDLNGSQGSSGNSDLNGSNGSIGSSDLDGSQGSSGNSDLEGSNGSNGNSDLNGSQGSDGSSNLDGSSGSNGNSDLNGSQGSNGNSDLNGSQGSNGSSDLDGSQGSDGSSNLDGSSGSNGNSNLDGSQG